MTQQLNSPSRARLTTAGRVRLVGAILALLTAVPLPGLVRAASAGQPSRTVLALYFSSEDYPPNSVQDAGIRE